MKPITIGLTGGVGAGKSLVLSELRKIGAQVIDADKVGHEAYLPGTNCIQKLVDHFGKKIIGTDGFVNRKVLGEIVFQNKSERKALNAIVWPAIKDLLISKKQAIIESNMSDCIIVIEAAIMIEAGWTDIVDELWVVAAKTELRVRRLIHRNNVTEEVALKMIHSQISDMEREKVADVILTNNSSEEDLIQVIHKELLALKQRRNSSLDSNM